MILVPPTAERRLLQAAIALACLVPLFAGGSGIIEGPAMVRGITASAPVDLDSHFRYLSGLLFGIGLAFAACIPRIEARSTLFRTLVAIVAVGGLARLLSLATLGPPGPGHIFGLCMELGVVPALALWQARVARLCAHANGPGKKSWPEKS